MAVVMENLYSALKQAGADGQRAKTAAEEVAGDDSRIGDLETEPRTELAPIRGELSPAKWMVGFNVRHRRAAVSREPLKNSWK